MGNQWKQSRLPKYTCFLKYADFCCLGVDKLSFMGYSTLIVFLR